MTRNRTSIKGRRTAHIRADRAIYNLTRHNEICHLRGTCKTASCRIWVRTRAIKYWCVGIKHTGVTSVPMVAVPIVVSMVTVAIIYVEMVSVAIIVDFFYMHMVAIPSIFVTIIVDIFYEHLFYVHMFYRRRRGRRRIVSVRVLV